ncbi:hypothetical protein MBLNU13_g10445t1 [Cladosporium sp. NU13]
MASSLRTPCVLDDYRIESDRMDGVDLVLRADFDVSPRVHEHLLTTSSSHQSFSHISASGSSRVHNGNNYYITYECSTGHGPMPLLRSDQQATVGQVSRLSQKRKRPVSDAPVITRDAQKRQTLATVLESLGQYSKSIQQQSEGEQSTRIADQLAIVLESLEQVSFDENKATDLDCQLQDLKHQLRRARSIKINAISPQAHASRPYNAQTKLTRIAWGQCEISLRTKTLHSRSCDGQMLTETCSALNVQHAVGSRGPCIAVYFRESVDFDRTMTMHPIVLAYNQVDNDAQVLKLVKNDDLDGFLRHLALGKASIRDCDEAGRSLLHPFEQILYEGSAFFDVRSFDINGQSLWMFACSNVSMHGSPGLLQLLVESGVTVAEVEDDGQNCLFKCVSDVSHPRLSKEFEALQYLLTVFEDVFARDKTGMNIFDMVETDKIQPFDPTMEIGSYKQDLWYCALYRAGLSRRLGIPPPITKPVFGSRYTIQHYRALLYLDTWNFSRLNDTTASPRMPCREEVAPGLSQWDPSDLRMMEDRIRAIHTIDDDADDDDDEDHYGENEYGGEVSHEKNDYDDENEFSAMDDSTHDLYGAPDE